LFPLYNAAIGYNKALELLNREYGNEFTVSNAFMDKLNKWPPIKNEDVKSLECLSIFLLECHHYLENMTYRNQLQSPQEIMNIVLKLPYKLRDKWRRNCYRHINNNGGVYFWNLVDFLAEEVAVLKQPIFGSINDKPASMRNNETFNHKKTTKGADKL
jgi:hypothetical protein